MDIENVLILIADDEPDIKGEVVVADGVVFPPSVPVIWEFDLKVNLGTATLRKEGFRILADIQLYDEGIKTLVRLHRPLIYPAIYGRIGQSHLREGASRVIETCEILSLSLGDDNTDLRIPALEFTSGVSS